MTYGKGSVHAHAAEAGPRASGALALTLQELFTVTVRVRASRQTAGDARQFRDRIKGLLRQADLDARALGYDGNDVKLALYALIAFLDECVLASSSPSFSDWARQPLQEEIFGDSIAGEVFYRHLNELLRRQDSPSTADVLEVFLLCLRLGFKGRYGGADDGTPAGVAAAAEDKIRRTRGHSSALSPDWRPPEDERVPQAGDPWVRRLAVAAAATAVGCLALFVVYRLLLGPAAAELEAMTAVLASGGTLG